MSSIPSYTLQMRAVDQRMRLHSTVKELRTRVRDRLDFQRTARQLVPLASGIAGLLSFLLGYGLAGIFMRR